MKIITGITNRILEINLSDQSFAQINASNKDIRMYLGGKGLGLKLLYDRMKPGIDPLSEEGIQAATGIGESGAGRIVAEGHVGGANFDSQPCKQLQQVWISPPVEDDKAGVDRGAGIRSGAEHNRAGVPTEVVVFLEQRHVMLLLQQISGSDTGNPCADHGDIQASVTDVHFVGPATDGRDARKREKIRRGRGVAPPPR